MQIQRLNAALAIDDRPTRTIATITEMTTHVMCNVIVSDMISLETPLNFVVHKPTHESEFSHGESFSTL